MTRDKIMNTAGLILLAGCFAWAVYNIIGRTWKEADPDRIVIRFAHWQLESGIRDAFDELAREYMRMHPHVVVEQMLIPERVYANWLITQLVGGTAPDLIEMRTMPDERIARYFTPLTDLVNEPNPYNEGNDLAGLPWRDTFIDGMSGFPAYVPNLFDFYAIPTTLFTIRMYYNVGLYRAIRGQTPVPQNYEQFIELCQAVEDYARQTGEPIIPIAGSQYNAPLVMFNLLASQTQRVGVQWSDDYRLLMNPDRIFLLFLDEQWDFHHPALYSAFSLMRSIGRFMQPGFLSLRRDDAMFYFVQGRALMIASGSWDITSMYAQAPFEIDAFAVPLPEPDHPVYGQHMFGPLTEAGHPTSAAFGLTRQSRHPEVAIDFMRFVTSQMGNQIFADKSNWLPAVVGVEPTERARPFAPMMEGFQGGFGPFFGADTRRVFDNNLHLLIGHGGTVEAFTQTLQAAFPAALIQDTRLRHAGRVRQFHRLDSLLAALEAQVDQPGLDTPENHRLNELIESTVDLEATMYWTQHEFDRMDRSLRY